ncbi:MAG: SIMPL domain-containing protein [Anaerolineae bacterium]|nr:SIMPL domain-containing protein [Anaerolineae bacterium]
MQLFFSRKLTRLALIAALVIAGVMAVMPVAAQDAPETPTRTITVTGLGTASGSPDQAILSLGVELRSQDLGEAVDQVNAAVAAVIEAMQAAGIAPEDIQTTNFSVYQDVPGYPMPADSGTTSAEPVYNYVVNNMVQVRVRDTAQLNAIIDAGLAAGANRIFGLSFAIGDQTELENAALEDAVADANSRAATLAAAIGVTLGDPISIRELSGNDMVFARDASMGLGGGGSISEGQLSISTQVQITYSIQ